MIINSVHLDGFNAAAEFTDDDREKFYAAEIKPETDTYAIYAVGKTERIEIENYSRIEDAAHSKYFNVLAHLEYMRRERRVFLPENVLLLIRDSVKEYRRKDGEHYARNTFMLGDIQRYVEIFQDFSSGNGPLVFSVNDSCEMNIIETFQGIEEAEQSPYYPLLVDLLEYFRYKAKEYLKEHWNE